MSADGTRAYTGNDGDLSVVDTAAGAVTSTIRLNGSGEGVAISPDGSRLYVAQLSGFVSVLDSASAGVIATVPVGRLPQDLAMSPDGRAVYVFDSRDATVTAIDTASNQVMATMSVPADSGYLAVTPDSRSVWVCNLHNPSPAFTVLDVATRTTGGTLPAPYSHGLAFASDGTRAYVAGGTAKGAISVLELPSGRSLGEIRTIDEPAADIVVSRDGRHLFVAASADITGGTDIRIIDLGTGFEVQRLPMDVPRRVALALSADGTRLVAAAEDSDVLFVFDVSNYA